MDVAYEGKRRVKEIPRPDQEEGCHRIETGKAADGKEKGELCLRHKWRNLVGIYKPGVWKLNIQAWSMEDILAWSYKCGSG